MNSHQLSGLRHVQLHLSKRIRALHLASVKNVSTSLVGEYSSVFKGNGIEFADFRQYTPDDDASKIDWLHSLKSNKLLVREYTEERNLNLFFVVDTSSSMLFGSQEKLKHEYAAEIAASISAGALSVGDAVGLCMTSNRVRKFVKSNLGARQVEAVVSALGSEENYGGRCKMGETLGKMSNMLPAGSLIFVISDFISHDPSWRRNMRIAARKHQLMCLIVRDPLDDELPAGAGQVAIQDPYTGEQLLIDADKVRDQYAAAAKAELDAVKLELVRAGVIFVDLHTDADYLPPLMALFRRKRLWS